jgi:hypothetical protein
MRGYVAYRDGAGPCGSASEGGAKEGDVDVPTRREAHQGGGPAARLEDGTDGLEEGTDGRAVRGRSDMEKGREGGAARALGVAFPFDLGGTPVGTAERAGSGDEAKVSEEEGGPNAADEVEGEEGLDVRRVAERGGRATEGQLVGWGEGGAARLRAVRRCEGLSSSEAEGGWGGGVRACGVVYVRAACPWALISSSPEEAM